MNYGPKPRPVYANTVIISDTFSTEAYTLEPDTLYRAPDGKQLTLTVDGVETELKAGTYTGNVVFTVTDDLGAIVHCCMHGETPPPPYRTALYVDENGVAAGKSVLAAAEELEYSAEAVTGGTLRSVGPLFNGITVKDTPYQIQNLHAEFTGRGGDDFNGYGAVLVATGNADLTVSDSTFETWGCIRGVMTAGQQSHVLMERCSVNCHGGSREEQEITDGMNEVPWVLGLSGNCRSTNLVQGANVIYRDCDMKAYGWGVLSTDAPSGTILTAENTTIEITGPSGYGSYSVGDATNIFRNCHFIVPDYAVVLAQMPGNGYVEIENSVIDSARFGLMWHSHTNQNASSVTGSVFNTGMTTFILKGCLANLNVESSQLNAGNGTILQMMDSDDAGLFASEFVVCDNAHPEKDPEFDLTAAHDTDVRVSFTDMELHGNLYNARTGKKIAPAGGPGQPPMEPVSTAANLVLSLDHVAFTGAATAAIEHHTNVAPGEAIRETENRIELGQVTNRPAPAVNNGVIVKLTNGSAWNAVCTSYLTSFEMDASSTLHGSMTLNGAAVSPVRGVLYTGQIVITEA